MAETALADEGIHAPASTDTQVRRKKTHEKPVNDELVEQTTQQLADIFNDLKADHEVSPMRVATALVAAQDASNEHLGLALTIIRRSRETNSSGRAERPVAGLFDQTIVTLAQSGHLDLIDSLISSSPREVEILDQAVDTSIQDDQERTDIKNRLHMIHQMKLSALRERLTSQGANPDIQQHILLYSIDPDSANTIDQGFWNLYNRLPHNALEKLLTATDMARAADTITAIDNKGLLAYTDAMLFSHLQNMPSPQAMEEHLQLLHDANESIPADTKKTRVGKQPVMWRLANEQTLTPEGVQASLRLQEFFNGEVSPPPSVYGETVTQVLKNETPLAAAQTFIDAYQKADHILEKPGVASAIAKSDNPGAFVDTLLTVESLLPKEKRSVKQLFRRQDYEQLQTRNLIQTAQAEVAFNNHGLSIRDMDADTATTFREALNAQIRNADEIDLFVRDWEIRNQYGQLVTSIVKPAIESGDYKDIESRFITLDDLPALQEKFATLGIDAQLGAAMFASWSTFNATQRELYSLQKKGISPSRRQMKDILQKTKIDQPEALDQQVRAMTTYAETYGNEELRTIIDTFGIYNFARYESEQLHNQLERWTNGEVIPNIAVSARADWNGFIQDYGYQMRSQFGEDVCFFEANDSLGISKVAVAIGNRERENGRDPLQTNPVRNFIISGHATPEHIELGVNGENLQIAHFVDAETRRAKLVSERNDYKRHLGNAFRLILHACGTAGRPANGDVNISTAISNWHDTPTEASAGKVQTFRIDSDNTVSFEHAGKQTLSLTHLPERAI